MKNIKSLILLTMLYVTNNFAMTPLKSSLPLEVKKNAFKPLLINQKQAAVKNTIQKELTDAGWSKEKIFELRLQNPSDSLKELMRQTVTLEKLKGRIAEIYYKNPFDALNLFNNPNEQIINNILINHYTQKIYRALATIPVNERLSWISHLTVLLKTKVYENIQYRFDGSELGMQGMKCQALEKIKNINIETIPFNFGQKITPAEFYKKITEPDYEKDTNQEIITLFEKEKPQQKLQSNFYQEKYEQEQKNAFMSDEEYTKQLKQERKKQYITNMCLIYEKGTSNGILINKKRLKECSEFARGISENMNNTLPNEIPLDFSFEVIKAVFNRSELETLSWNQLIDCIKCYNYLLLEDQPLSDAYYKTLVYWVNKIGNKMQDLTFEIKPSYHEKIQGRSIEAIEKDLPDYSIFKELKKSQINNGQQQNSFIVSLLKLKNCFLNNKKFNVQYLPHSDNVFVPSKSKKHLDIRNKMNSSFNNLHAISNTENIIISLLDEVKEVFYVEKKGRKKFEENAKK